SPHALRPTCRYVRTPAAVLSLPAGYYGTATGKIQMCDQRRPQERARRNFLEHGFPRDWFYFIDDVEFALLALDLLCAHICPPLRVTPKGPWFDGDPIHTRYVNHGNPHLARLGQQFLNVGKRIPAR